MITGLDEQYSYAETHSADKSEKYRYQVLDLFGWRVTFSNGMMIYERGAIDPVARNMSNYAEEWREPVSAIRSLQITATKQFDNARGICFPYGYKTPAFMAYFGLTVEKLGPKPKKDFLGADSRYINDLANWEKASKAPLPSAKEFAFHGKNDSTSLVLFAFFLDGSRRLISQREDLTNTIDGTRGYDALLGQQSALMRGVQNERRAKIKNKEVAIERSLYL